jgi:hypothetical protein
MSSRFAALLFAVTISLVPLARAEAAPAGEACTVRLGPTTGLHAAPRAGVRRVVAMESLGMGRFRGECGPARERRA